MEILQVENLSFRYPDAEKCALDGVNFSVNSGDFIVICGKSGCGKTTLLKLLKRELTPFGECTGSICYMGNQLVALDADITAGGIGYVFQNPENQIVTDKVWHELAFGLENLGLPTEVIRRRVAEMASYFGIQEWFRKNTYELSGGQKQMLNLASVMIMQPKVLLLDEPTAQLDPIAAADFIATLQKLNQELGLTVILVEHRLEEVFPVADKVMLLEDGNLLFYEHPKKMGEYLRTHMHEMMAGLPSAMRIFEALSGEGDCPLTVKEGREYITKQYDNSIDRLEIPPYEHKDALALELKNVWFRYERDLPDVLRGISLKVYEQEIFCILGGNGTGKTTALGVAAGLLKAYRGDVLVDGRKIAAFKNNELYRHHLAMLPQNPQTVFLQQTVREDFAEICTAMGYKKEEREMMITEIAGKLDITNLLERHPYDLSGGEQQKAAVAKILLTKPRILLLDEPTKGIDAHTKQLLADILKRLKADGLTVLIVTHDVEFAAANADRCALFFDGEVISVDTPTAFFSGNNFYTTAANRIARGRYHNAVTCEDVVELCRKNMPTVEEK
ncbi:MAG: energy-coupling factor ABC transporter ATP-binding protein [Lachnospiraceae bacterium]|nr:energy-coupling factor ABC transporter ATP-binding protein [Lachnospiraceae bacterium]